MKIDYPGQQHIPELKQLWQEAFGDDAATVDAYFETAFSLDRCRCVLENGRVAAALHILDCKCDGRPMAYLYAVATGKKHRRKGLCRQLLEDTRKLLAALGYHGILLVPETAALQQFYATMGYETCTFVREFTCHAGELSATLTPLDAAQYAQRRRKYLCVGGVVQEGAALAFLATQSRFFEGAHFLYAENAELLGDMEAAPGILKALGQKTGTFRTVGGEVPFAMYLPLKEGYRPKYFGLALD